MVLLLAGCTWSNALYRARRLAGSAERAERQERSFEADNLWGQVAVKAESAYGRSSRGEKGAEALWLRGRALSRLGNCETAMPLLDQAASQAAGADWGVELRLDMARCQILLDRNDDALAALTNIGTEVDDAVLEEVQLLRGRALVGAGEWQQALTALGNDDSRDGHWQRAIAAAHLGRFSTLAELVDQRIAVADTGANWGVLLGVLAEHGVAQADSLERLLDKMPLANDTLRARWRLALANGLEARQPAQSDSVLRTILALPGGNQVSGQVRITLGERNIANSHDSASLVSSLAATDSLAKGGPAAAFVLGRLLDAGRMIVSDLGSYPAATPLGDLVFFDDATIARDSLRAPRLAAWLLGQMEQRWPESPYLAKAMMLRIVLSPDSAAAIRGRVAALTASPYLAYIEGKAGPRFTALEDSLGRFLAARAELSRKSREREVPNDSRDVFE